MSFPPPVLNHLQFLHTASDQNLVVGMTLGTRLIWTFSRLLVQNCVLLQLRLLDCCS